MQLEQMLGGAWGCIWRKVDSWMFSKPHRVTYPCFSVRNVLFLWLTAGVVGQGPQGLGFLLGKLKMVPWGLRSPSSGYSSCLNPICSLKTPLRDQSFQRVCLKASDVIRLCFWFPSEAENPRTRVSHQCARAQSAAL